MSAMASKTATAANLGADLKSAGTSTERPKPCCVCKEEKSKRDECMLFSTSDNAQLECKDLVSQYKSCMAGYGFNI